MEYAELTKKMDKLFRLNLIYIFSLIIDIIYSEMGSYIMTYYNTYHNDTCHDDTCHDDTCHDDTYDDDISDIVGDHEFVKDDIEYTADDLYQSIINNNIGDMMMIINSGVPCGNLELYIAILYGNLNIVKIIVENFNDVLDKEHACIYAAEHGHLNIIKYLISKKFACGMNVHRMAFAHGYNDICKWWMNNIYR
jgi:hypothetical protein